MGDISPEFYSSNFLCKIKGLIPPVSINKENELFFELQELKKVHISVFIQSVILLSSRNPLDSEAEAIKVYDPDFSRNRAFIAALLTTGFRQIPEDDLSLDKFLPCPLGTFSNSSSKGTLGCTKCPAGIYMAQFSQYSVCYYIYDNIWQQIPIYYDYTKKHVLFLA